MLSRLMARTSLVEALKGQTTVGDRVYDSALTTMPKDGAGPFLSVYTGQGDMQGRSGSSMRPLLGTSKCLLVFQYGVTAEMVEIDPGTLQSKIVGFDFPPVDAGLQMALDLIGRQLADALVTPSNAWGEFAQQVAQQFNDVRLEPGVSNEDGLRLATHQLSMIADLADEPVTRNELVEDYLALLAGSDDPLHAEQHALIEGLVSGDVDEIDAVRRKLGQSLAVWRSGPLPDVAANEGEVFAEAIVEPEGHDAETVTDAG